MDETASIYFDRFSYTLFNNCVLFSFIVFGSLFCLAMFTEKTTQSGVEGDCYTRELHKLRLFLQG